MHRSWCAENAGHPSNERLEFLGDAVLGVVVTDHIYRVYPDLDEGALTEIRKTVVNSVTLAEVAESIGVGEHLLLGKGEELSGGREKPSILADALEAIIGATYLAEGLEAATVLVLGVLGGRLATAQVDGADHKSRLQELSAHLFSTPPRYEVTPAAPTTPARSSSPPRSAGRPTAKARAAPRSRPSRPPRAPRWKPWSTTNPTTLRETHHG